MLNQDKENTETNIENNMYISINRSETRETCNDIIKNLPDIRSKEIKSKTYLKPRLKSLQKLPTPIKSSFPSTTINTKQHRGFQSDKLVPQMLPELYTLADA